MSQKQKGFTIIELMITMVIAAIVLAFAAPSFMDLVEKNRVRTATEQLVELFRMSRVVAVEQRNMVSVCGSSDSSSCDNDWGTSIISLKRGEEAADDEVLARLNISDKISVSKNGTHTRVDFRTSGWAPADNTTITLCPVDGDFHNAYRIIVASSGKVKIKANLEGDTTWC